MKKETDKYLATARVKQILKQLANTDISGKRYLKDL